MAKYSGEKNRKNSKFKILVRLDDFSFKSTKQVSELGIFALKARLAFAELRQIFIEVLILYHFNSEYYIHIKTNISGYVIYKHFS